MSSTSHSAQFEDMAELAPDTLRFSERVNRLSQAFRRRDAEVSIQGSRLHLEADEVAARNDAFLAAWRSTPGQPAILRRCRALECFADAALIRLMPDDLLAGSQKFSAMGFPAAVSTELYALGYASNGGHIINDYASLLELGVGGHIARIHARAEKDAAPAAETITTLTGFERALHAFSRFIERHAAAAETLANSVPPAQKEEWQTRAHDLHLVATSAPRHFRQAIQLIWLMQIYLHVENPSSAISFGRLDQCLWPFLKQDLATGAISRQAAYDIIGAFCLRCCEGEESQNLALGGVDSDGRDATNLVSFMFLQAVLELRAFQPSLCVRIHDGTDSAFVRAACRLAAAGIGQPGFINDKPAIAGLMAAGIPLERARDYGIVGCYEASPQGDTWANTVGGHLTLPEILVNYMSTTTAQATRSFDQFLDGWYKAVDSTYSNMLATHAQPTLDAWRKNAPSPFGSVFLKGCVERALPMESCGADNNLFGINILGLGTTVDSLHAINTFVFKSSKYTLEDLSTAVADDFPDEAMRQDLFQNAGRYGTDNPSTNALVHEVSGRIARMVLESRLANGVRPYPAFFRFTADIWDRRCATPDGRHKNDFLSYGCGPATSSANSPTSVLASASHVAHDLCACGNPLAVSLQSADVAGPAGIDRLQALILGYMHMGGFHVHFNIVSAAEMRQAQEHPDSHGDLTVRISGFSARFVTLEPIIQTALIERA